MGDSLSAGIDGDTAEPWPDRVARALAAEDGDLAFRNLARTGATSTDVAIWQLQEAIEHRPDLVSVVCGGNDVLLSVRPDPDMFAAVLDEILATLRRRVPDARVVTATYPRLATMLPLRERTERRVEAGVEAVNAHIRRLAAQHGATCLEWAGHAGVDDPDNFASDGLHPSAAGHARASEAFLAALRDIAGPPRDREEDR
ncbi:MAG: SGNH/GDSL hydrolase family protein [Thermoleophilaceae bacterium]